MARDMTWDEYYMRMASLASRMSTCSRKQVGAVLVRDGKVLSTGVNGAPRHLPHCIDVGCLLNNGHCVRCIHAEMNAIIQCAINGVSPVGSTLYCSYTPCMECAKCLIQAGVTRIMYEKIYDANVVEYIKPHLKLVHIDMPAENS